jgi:DNA-directed RNA polymerase specialized sigma subunit
VTEAERLFHANLEWAAAIARNVARHLPPSFDAGDLIQEAHIELWKRAQQYDSSRNDSFQGFAYLPIRSHHPRPGAGARRQRVCP